MSYLFVFHLINGNVPHFPVSFFLLRLGKQRRSMAKFHFNSLLKRDVGGAEYVVQRCGKYTALRSVDCSIVQFIFSLDHVKFHFNSVITTPNKM